MPLHSPDHNLLSRPFFLRADGLPQSVEVTVAAQTTDLHGEVWQCAATFITSPVGQLDLSKQPALAGCYEGVDPTGLIWSMQPRADLTPAFFEPPAGGYDVTIRVMQDGQVLEEGQARRLSRSPELQAEPVREGGLYGTLFRPSTPQHLRGACLCLGGSEGGLYDSIAALLASEGFLVLNLAYFGLPESGLPESLINIPLEYFGQAIHWLRALPEVAGRRVGVTGASKGAEAALLIGATFPEEVGAVAAIASGGLVFEGIDRTGQFPKGQPMSSWSWQGKPWPYIPYRTDWQAFFSSPGSKAMTPVHQRALEQASQAEIVAATIPVEKIAGPVLLVSGGQDQVWNATELSEIAYRRRQASGQPVEHLSDPRAGHSLSLPGLPTYVNVPWTPMGGEPQATAHLQMQAWDARVRTLENIWE